jgi:MFS family permease
VFLLLHLCVSLVYYNATTVSMVMVLVVIGPLIPATLPLVMNNIQGLAPPNMRAQAAALLLTTSTLIGMSVGPPLVGFLSDFFSAEYGRNSMRYALMCVVTVGWLWAALHYYLASRTYAVDLAAKEKLV